MSYYFRVFADHLDSCFFEQNMQTSTRIYHKTHHPLFCCCFSDAHSSHLKDLRQKPQASWSSTPPLIGPKRTSPSVQGNVTRWELFQGRSDLSDWATGSRKKQAKSWKNLSYFLWLVCCFLIWYWLLTNVLNVTFRVPTHQMSCIWSA